MTKVIKKEVMCYQCKRLSEQLFVCSINFNIGKKEDNDKLVNHQQVCQHCQYTAHHIASSH